ncbi:PAS domain-containing sensor histidine kinase [Herbivorax sp. ANBcel31]|uniref:PAS domain-containing sensor histidine kinase n=1 Tax=Herbivorax sp. ANBcel31 TaxID=3069754 RepID=UPI0027B186EE|nr:PAS domain-containing sensor histidine kinase [Herbivorax sp. ANBcel31]MDQ2084919.1 PAS domain-containing sensor histidine kinase [Herbivorax sp. ANBcel31]
MIDKPCNDYNENKKQNTIKTIFESAPVGMMIVDKETRIIDINYGIISINKKKYKEIVGKKFGEGMGCINSFEKGCGYSEECCNCIIRKNIEKVIDTGRERKNIEVEYKILTQKKTALKTLKINIAQVIYNNEIVYLLVVDDITISKKKSRILLDTTKKLKEAKEEAEESIIERNRFLDNMSHEIRTPLNGITGMIELTLVGKLEDEQRLNIEIAQNCVDKLLKIVDDLFDFSKMKAGEMKLSKTIFEIRSLISDIENIYTPIAVEKEIEFNCFVSENVPDKIFTDRTRLKKVIDSLLNNAFKFTPEGSISLEVKAEKCNGEKYLFFDIEDTGIGIEKKDLEKLFERFTQVDGSYTRKYSGAGMGLNISKYIIKKMGGDIFVESKKGEGSKFSFNIKFEEEKN